MEPFKIDLLLEKYFEAETSIAEENDLRTFFSSQEVPEHLQQYQSIFGYFEITKEQKFEQKTQPQRKKRSVKWLSIAASIVIMLGVGIFSYNNLKTFPNQDLGDFKTPEAAFEATQKALLMLSENVNVGVSGATHMQEFNNVKDKVFKTE